MRSQPLPSYQSYHMVSIVASESGGHRPSIGKSEAARFILTTDFRADLLPAFFLHIPKAATPFLLPIMSLDLYRRLRTSWTLSQHGSLKHSVACMRRPSGKPSQSLHFKDSGRTKLGGCVIHVCNSPDTSSRQYLRVRQNCRGYNAAHLIDRLIRSRSPLVTL